MKNRTRRTIEVFSLSFLDIVCCGFGAVILLLVLSKYAEPTVIEETHKNLSGRVEQLEKKRAEIKGETHVLNRQLTAKQQQLSQQKERLATLQGSLSNFSGQFSSSKQKANVKNIIEGQLASAKQNLTEEMRRLSRNPGKRSNPGLIGGIPVDSEYIIFVIDTSGSMYNYSWSLVIQKVTETLDIYPKVKGIQVMNDMGNYMFSQYRGKWIPDTPARRKAIVQRLRTWNSFSNSSPVEGITHAIRTFYTQKRKISIYVFGDEFSGPSIDAVITEVDRINKADKYGNRLVRIHAVGFPVLFSQPANQQQTGTRFATLMRIICQRNGGTFIGLNRFKR